MDDAIESLENKIAALEVKVKMLAKIEKQRCVPLDNVIAEMRGLKNAIQRKPRWKVKIIQPVIYHKWKKEAEEQKISPGAIYGAFVDLLAIAQGTEPHVIQWTDHVYFTDSAVPESLRLELVKELQELVDRPPFNIPDYHPGTEKRVLDLIHPSLYPYHDVALELKREKEEEKEKKRNEEDRRQHWMLEPSMLDRFEREFEESVYRWLPARFSKKKKGFFGKEEGKEKDKGKETVQLTSYINNVNVIRHPQLSKTITKVFNKVYPFFSHVGKHLFEKNVLHSVVDYGFGSKEEEEEKEKDNEYLHEHVIVKAANIVLQPGEEHEGVWHVEGMSSDNIVASAIYYYDVDPGIVGAGLSFRSEREHDGEDDISRLSSERDTLEQRLHEMARLNWIAEGGKNEEDFEGMFDAYAQTEDFHNLGLQMKNHIFLGTVKTTQNRVLYFSNKLQHKVERLVNTTSQVQRRKILCFFLVRDTLPLYQQKKPETYRSIPLLSTAVIEEQQWYFRDQTLQDTLQSILLPELVKIVCGYAFQGMTFEEALQHRVKLMHERKTFRDSQNREFEREFSLCEH